MRDLFEFYNFNAVSAMPIKMDVSNEDIRNFKKLKWNKIKMLEPSVTQMGSTNIFNMEFDLGEKLNHLKPSIVFKIEQDSRTELNQPHIQVYKGLYRLGIAYNLYRLTLEEFGHLVSKESKRFSDDEITGLYEKLAKDSQIDLFKKDGNLLLLHKKNPEYDKVKETFEYIL